MCGGGITGDEFNPITFEEAITIVKNDFPVIIKPSRDSGLGRNISKIVTSDNIEATLRKYDKDYVIQKTIELCPELKTISPNSVCVMRIITAIIDEKPVVLSACLRLNTEDDAVADNQITEDGKGMLVIGITREGTLKKQGVYSCGQQISKLLNGTEFFGIKIPKYEEVLNMVMKAHLQMPMFKAVGWDITIDEDYKPIVIEYNLKGMGIYYYQLVNGPLFGKYTNSILNLIKE